MMLSLALGAAALLMGAVSVLLLFAGRGRARALADEVRGSIEPYLRRKAAERGWPPEAPVWTARSTPEEIVTWSARMAARLQDRERSAPSPEASDLALQETQRLDNAKQLLVTATGTTTNRLDRKDAGEP